MAIHTVTTTAEQEALLQRLATRYNTTQIPPTTLTADDYFKQVILTVLFRKYKKQFDVEDSMRIREAWENANAIIRAQVKTALGL